MPALGALAAEPLYVLVDTAVVGHLGTEQLAGLAVAGTILTTGFFLFNFLAYGTTASVARLFGAAQLEAAAHQAVQGMWIAVGLGLGIVAAGTAASGALVDVMGAGAAVRPHALTYLRISLLGSPMVLITLVGMGYLRGLQDTRTTFVVAVASNAANLAIELVLIYGMGMGIGASAAATVVAQSGAAAAYAVFILRAVAAEEVALSPDWQRMRALLVMGRDLFVRTGALLLALAAATAVAARLGTVSVAAHQIAFQVWTFLALILDAVAIAGQAMIGRFLGAGDAAEARVAGMRMVQWGVAAGVVLGGAVVAGRPALVPLFTGDPDVARLAAGVLLLVAVMQPLNAVVFVLDGVLIGAGDLRYLARAMVLASFAVFLPAAVVVERFELSLYALWGGLILLMVARTAGNVVRFAGSAWQLTGSERS